MDTADVLQGEEGGRLKLRRDWVNRNLKGQRRSADWEDTVEDCDGWR